MPGVPILMGRYPLVGLFLVALIYLWFKWPRWGAITTGVTIVLWALLRVWRRSR